MNNKKRKIKILKIPLSHIAFVDYAHVHYTAALLNPTNLEVQLAQRQYLCCKKISSSHFLKHKVAYLQGYNVKNDSL